MCPYPEWTLRRVRRREGCDLLRAALAAQQSFALWRFGIHLTEVAPTYKVIKDASVAPSG